MWKSLFILSLFVCSSLCFHRPCHRGYPEPTSVVSPSCDAAGCIVYIGGSITGSVTFTPSQAHSNLITFLEVFDADANAWFDYPLTSPNDVACDYMSPGCPTTPGVSQVWTLDFPIRPDDTPVAPTFWEFHLVDMSSLEVALCFQVTAELRYGFVPTN